MITSELIGIAIGGFLGARLGRGERWFRVLAPAAIAMGVLLVAMGSIAYLPSLWVLPSAFVLLGLIGVVGGIFLIPCEAFIQVRPPASKKGAVLAAANFAVFSGILLSGPLAAVLTARTAATECFAIIGVLTLLVGVWLRIVLGRRQER